MKKALFLSLTLLISCVHNHSVIAHDQNVANEDVAAVSEFEQLDEATQMRMIKVATFLNLIQKVHTGEMDVRKVMNFALDWAQELEKSDDPTDQELCKKLYQIIIELTENLQAQEEVEATQESGEDN